MNWKKYSHLRDKHAFLSASKYHWTNYTDDKLVDVYKKNLAVKKGTVLHDLAARLSSVGQKLPNKKRTFNMYVNDAIRYKMKPEQILFYSVNCFGTADAISFEDNKLKIFDLKTGQTKAHIEQLLVYAALFCLEYEHNPADIEVELRIYQNNEIWECNPTPEDLVPIMDKIIRFDNIIEKIKEEEGI